MQTKYFLTLLAGMLFYLAAFSQAPANDECSNAVTLTVGTNSCTNPISGTTNNATQSANLPLPFCSNDGINDDVWYTLTATSAGVMNLNLTNLTPASPLFVMVYTGTCSNLADYFCTYGNLSYHFFVTQGTAYYFRVFSSSPDLIVYNDFTICAFMTDNDECSTAKHITVGSGGCSDIYFGTTQPATQSNTVPFPACGGNGYDDDVWYKFTAAINGNILMNVYNQGAASTDVSVQVYSGSCTGIGLTLLNCNTTTNYQGNFILINATATTDYYIRVFTPGPAPDYYEFYICAFTVEPPANDDCSAAQQITPGINTCTTGFLYETTLGATESLNIPLPNCNSTGIDDDVWFTFNATSTGVVRVELENYTYSGNTAGLVLQAYSGTACSNLTSGLCNTFSGNGSLDINVTAGTDYFVRAYTMESNASNFSTFGICIYYPPPVPANNECSAAVLLTVNSSSCTALTPGTTIGASESQQGCNGSADDDVWYEFTATSVYHKIIVSPATTNGISDVVFEVFSGTCSSPASLYCVNNTTGPDNEEQNVSGLTIGSTYYVRVYSNSSNSSARGEFNICLGIPQASVSITASETTICPGTNVTFTATPVNGGTAPIYQWKKNGQPVGSDNPVYLDAALVQSDIITCTLTSNDPSVSNPTVTSDDFIITIDPNCYCTPVNTNGCTSNITNVTINGSSNPTSDCPGNGYTFFPGVFITVQQATLASFSVTTLNTFTYTRIWIDFNDNFSFDDPGELVFAQSRNGLTAVNGSFFISPTANTGNHRIRIRNDAAPSFSPCNAAAAGETEDYTINITGGIPCSDLGLPTASFTSASQYVVCSGGSADVTAYANGLNISYQWQQSATPNNLDFTNIANATASTYAANGIVASTYYRCMFTCAGNENPSPVLAITIGVVPANDNICNAILMTDGVLNYQNTTCATAGEEIINNPAASCSTPNNTVWYKYTPATTGRLTLKIEKTPNDPYPIDAWVTVYSSTGICPSQPVLTYVSPLPWNCLRANLPNDSVAVVTTGILDGYPDDLSGILQAGSTYYIMIDGFIGSSGGFGITSQPVNPPVFWTGNVNNDWATAGNWSSGTVPGPNTDVIIVSGRLNYPELNSNVSIKSLKLNPGTSFVANNGFTITIVGN